jgi:hypothetical protein
MLSQVWHQSLRKATLWATLPLACLLDRVTLLLPAPCWKHFRNSTSKRTASHLSFSRAGPVFKYKRKTLALLLCLSIKLWLPQERCLLCPRWSQSSLWGVHGGSYSGLGLLSISLPPVPPWTPWEYTEKDQGRLFKAFSCPRGVLSLGALWMNSTVLTYWGLEEGEKLVFALNKIPLGWNRQDSPQNPSRAEQRQNRKLQLGSFPDGRIARQCRPERKGNLLYQGKARRLNSMKHSMYWVLILCLAFSWELWWNNSILTYYL